MMVGPCPDRMRLGYGRCSTDEQEEALQAQVARLQGAGCDRVITDLESGRSNDRDGLLEAMALIRAGEVAELVVTRLDRLGRDAAHTDMVLGLAAERGVTVTAIDGGAIEVASPQGFLMARLQTTMAEVESRMLSMRLRRQFEVYRAQGRHLRRRKPFGYRGGPDHRLEPHPEQWDVALQVLRELQRLGSFTKAANTMPEWCIWTPAAGSLQGWFVNPVIRGHIGHGRSGPKGHPQWAEIHYDQHPALINETEWQQLADHLRRPINRFLGGPTVDARHGLTGLLRCHSCLHLMRRNSAQGVVWWRCRHRLCKARGGIKERDVLPVVLQACQASAERIANAVAEPAGEDPAVATKRRDLEQLELLAARNPGLMPAARTLRQEIESMTRQGGVVLPDLERVRQAVSDPRFFAAATAEEQRAMYGELLQMVMVGPGGDPVVVVPRTSAAG